MEICIESDEQTNQQLSHHVDDSEIHSGTVADINNTQKVTDTNSFIQSLLKTHCPQALKFNCSLEYELQTFKDTAASIKPLDFWIEHGKSFPKLAAVAKVVLAIPLTTSKSEGSFSVSGCVVRSRRASISPIRVEKFYSSMTTFNSYISNS